MKNISRRTFLKLSAIVGAALAGVNQFIRQSDLTALTFPKFSPKNFEEKWVATSCLDCSSRCAIRVKIVNSKVERIT